MANIALMLAQINRTGMVRFLQTNPFPRQFDDMFFDPVQLQEQRRQADERSIELLRSCLTPRQRHEFDTLKSFVVRGSETGERYRIDQPTKAYNVALLDDAGDIVFRLCFVPKGGVTAIGDVMLAQKIWLENDELAARAIANRLTQASAYFGHYS
jgi:hypothetical protein